MHHLQIPDLKALEVALSGLDAGVTEDFGEVEQISAVPQIRDGEAVPQTYAGRIERQ
jgi:hypothetical protein